MNALNTKKNAHSGFTIVELLIVVVVIAILAAITIVSFNGITSRAHDANIASYISQLHKKALLGSIEGGSLDPTTVDDQSSALYQALHIAVPNTSIAKDQNYPVLMGYNHELNYTYDPVQGRWTTEEGDKLVFTAIAKSASGKVFFAQSRDGNDVSVVRFADGVLKAIEQDLQDTQGILTYAQNYDCAVDPESIGASCRDDIEYRIRWSQDNIDTLQTKKNRILAGDDGYNITHKTGYESDEAVYHYVCLEATVDTLDAIGIGGNIEYAYDKTAGSWVRANFYCGTN